MKTTSSGKAIDVLEIAQVLSKRLPLLPVVDRITTLSALFGQRVIATSSFGATSAAFLHLVSQAAPGITALNIQHGHETEETLHFIRLCKERFAINLVTERAPHIPVPEIGTKAFDYFRQETKVKPLRRALSKLDAWFWLSGVMHDETASRESFEMARVRHGVVVLYPILDWTNRKALEYCMENNLPLNTNYVDPCKGPDQSLECGLHWDVPTVASSH